MPRTSPPVARIAGVLAFLLFTRAGAATPEPRDYEFRHDNVLGTSMDLVVRADTESAATAAEARTLAEIDRLARILSGYDPSSEFRRWLATIGEPVKISPELFELLRASDRWCQASGGAFDPRVQVLTELWSRCARIDRRPAAGELATARAMLAVPAWRLDDIHGTAERRTACPLSLNSIGKGYIIGRACDAALDPKRGVHGVLLNIGGDVRAVGDGTRLVGLAPPAGDSESAGPVALIQVQNRSVATSGRAQRGFTIGGRWYSHIFDPRTGEPAAQVVSATVIAPQAAEANALATTLNVLPPDDGLRLAASVPGAECIIFTADGQVRRSPGWSRYEPRMTALTSPVRPAAPAADDRAAIARNSWGDTHELRVTFEINGPAGNTRRYRRPYVAVWVEDGDGLTTRTLALWVMTRQPGPRWHPDLKRWYRDDQVRRLADNANLIDTISRPTRPPGKYAVTWDGKDDHGKPLGPGKYTVCIEAAREHGTYQIIRKDVAIGDKPFASDLKGNAEIKSASIEFRPKGQGR